MFENTLIQTVCVTREKQNLHGNFCWHAVAQPTKLMDCALLPCCNYTKVINTVRVIWKIFMVLTKNAGTSEIFTEETCPVNLVVCSYETLNGFELQWNPGQIRARYFFLTDLLHCSLSQTVTEVVVFFPYKKVNLCSQGRILSSQLLEGGRHTITHLAFIPCRRKKSKRYVSK